MKKTHVFALNLRFMRIPLMLCMFLSFIASIVIISSNIPPLSLGENLSGALISSASVLKAEGGSAGVFSLIKKTSSRKKDENSTQTLQSPAAENSGENILARTPQKGSSPTEVKVSNSTDYDININDYLSGMPPFLKEDLSVLIVHTHTTESYTPSEKYNYTPTDTDRTRDKEYNMVRVGEEIKKILEANNIKVQHDTTTNDYPSYNGSYNRSSANVTNAIANNQSIKIVLDVHRDAIEGANGEKVKYTCDIDGKQAACVMLVAGSNLSGLTHDNWETNMQFAATLQQHIQSFYPDLMRPINFRSQRFNQQLAPGAIIVEIGTNGNTLDEALLGAQCFANALSDYIKTASAK